MNFLKDIIAVPFGYLMEICCKIFPNYLAALAVFTVILQILLGILFGIKQQKNSVKQAQLAPKVAAIRKKYAGRNDQQTMMKMNEETQALYQEHGYNQLGGCLPMLIQLPVIMGLYYVITEPLRFICGVFRTDATAFSELVKKFVDAELVSNNIRSQQYEIIRFITNPANAGKWEGFMGEQSLSVVPEFNVGPFDLSSIPEVASWLVLIPILIFVTSVASQIITRKFTYQDPMMKEQQNNPSMKIMMYSMPLLSVWISFSLPAAVGVYWIYRSVAATVQQIILSFLIPPPKFTEEDYKKAEDELKSKNKNKRNKNTTPRDPNAPKKRSLHHIDDEEETPAVAAPVARTEKEIEAAVSDEAEPSSILKDAPVMKEDKGSHYKKK